jgi:hypothetical protein
MADFSDDDLLAELGVSKQQKKAAKHTPSEERTIAGFEDIQRFFETNNRPPQHGDSLDIVERLYAVRLDRLRETPEACALLAQFDLHGLLTVPTGLAPRDLDALNDHDLLAELGPDIAHARNDRRRKRSQTAPPVGTLSSSSLYSNKLKLNFSLAFARHDRLERMQVSRWRISSYLAASLFM